MTLLSGILLLTLLTGCDPNEGRDGDDTAEAGACPGYDGCYDWCVGLEPALEAIANEGGSGWTEEMATHHAEICASVQGETDCEACLVTVGQDLVTYHNVSFACGAGFDSESIRIGLQVGEEDWSEADYEHYRDSCYSTCETFGLPHDGGLVGHERPEWPECEAGEPDCLTMCVDTLVGAGLDADEAEAYCRMEDTTTGSACESCWESIGDLGVSATGCEAGGWPDDGTSAGCYAVCEEYEVWY